MVFRRPLISLRISVHVAWLVIVRRRPTLTWQGKKELLQHVAHDENSLIVILQPQTMVEIAQKHTNYWSLIFFRDFEMDHHVCKRPN